MLCGPECAPLYAGRTVSVDRAAPAEPRPLSVVIAAAGTGGHIYPGLALADALAAAAPDTSIAIVGTPRGLEGRLVPEAGYPLHLYPMVPLTGRTAARLPLAASRSTRRARALLRQLQADVAVSMGGYGGVPLALAARSLGIPLVVHEAHPVPGRATTLTARFATLTAYSFPAVADRLPRGQHVLTGSPVFRPLDAVARARLRPRARAERGFSDEDFVVFIFGGSQGAVTLNHLALGCAERWRDEPRLRIRLKTGPAHLAGVSAQIAAAGLADRIEAQDYVASMAEEYAACDVVVSRAGAGTVTELALAGVPSILVPFAAAVDDHQRHNAQTLVDAGAALMVADDEATAVVVAPLIEALQADRSALSAMATAAAGQARPGAAAHLAALVIAVGRERRDR